MTVEISDIFPKYTQFHPIVPVWCVTPNKGGVIHRFFDTSPFSPSGRYMALTRFPFEDRLPKPGDVAEIILVDLKTAEEQVVADTRGWDTQLGAQVQWGVNDNQLFFNDVDTKSWQVFGVRLDPFSGTKKNIDGPVYMVSPNGRFAASPCLLRTGITQRGYGVIVPPEKVPRNQGVSSDDGLYITDITTGKSKLLISISEIMERAKPRINLKEYKDGDFYGFHVKWNLQGDRLMFLLRWVRRGNKRHWLNYVNKKWKKKIKRNLITMKPDGSDIHFAIPEGRWPIGGHHVNWDPDGEMITVNLRLDGKNLRFVKLKYDGTQYEGMSDFQGSGHPTLHPSGRYILTDVYTSEPLAFGDGTTPIRLIDLKQGQEKTLVRIKTESPYFGPKKELRVDPHPAWDRNFQMIAFNACPEGTRKVYVADLRQFTEAMED